MRAHAASRRLFEKGAPDRGKGHVATSTRDVSKAAPWTSRGVARLMWVWAQEVVVLCSQRTHNSLKSPSSGFLPPSTPLLVYRIISV